MPLTLYETFAWQTFASLRLFTCLVYVSTHCMPIAHLRQNKPFPLLYLGHAQIINYLLISYLVSKQVRLKTDYLSVLVFHSFYFDHIYDEIEGKARLSFACCLQSLKKENNSVENRNCGSCNNH